MALDHPVDIGSLSMHCHDAIRADLVAMPDLCRVDQAQRIHHLEYG